MSWSKLFVTPCKTFACWRERTPVSEARLLGVCFVLLFSGFTTTQGLETSVDAEQGPRALFVLYFCLAFGALFLAAPIVAWFETRGTLVLASFTYSAFIGVHCLSDGLLRQILLYLSSALLGFGASALWNAQGTHLNRLADGDVANMVTLSAVFSSIFGLMSVLGSAVVTFLFALEIDVRAASAALLGLSLCGNLALCSLTKDGRLDVGASNAAARTQAEQKFDLLSKVLVVGRMLPTMRGICSVPLWASNGLAESFFISFVAPMVPSMTHKAIVLTSMGLIASITGTVASVTSKKMGSAALVVCQIVSTTVGSLTIILAPSPAPLHLALLAGLSYGVFMGVRVSCNYGAITALWPGGASAGIAFFQLVSSTSMSLGFILAQQIGPWGQGRLVWTLQVLQLMSIMFFYKRGISVFSKPCKVEVQQVGGDQADKGSDDGTVLEDLGTTVVEEERDTVGLLHGAEETDKQPTAL